MASHKVESIECHRPHGDVLWSQQLEMSVIETCCEAMNRKFSWMFPEVPFSASFSIFNLKFNHAQFAIINLVFATFDEGQRIHRACYYKVTCFDLVAA